MFLSVFETNDYFKMNGQMTTFVPHLKGLERAQLCIHLFLRKSTSRSEVGGNMGTVDVGKESAGFSGNESSSIFGYLDEQSYPNSTTTDANVNLKNLGGNDKEKDGDVVGNENGGLNQAILNKRKPMWSAKLSTKPMVFW